jgi:hypothetical protein
MDGETLWNNIVMKIQHPPIDKKIWKDKQQTKKLSVAIVEPRCHKWLQGVLYNMAHVYGGTDVSLFIFHGTTNYQFIQDIIKDWQNVNYVQLPVTNLNAKEYSKLLTTSSFYQNFKSEHVLIFQTDSLIRRPLDEVYFKYNWCGAPWLAKRMGCGNGGFSLRRVSKMIEICNRYGSSEYNEDMYFDTHLRIGDYPIGELQRGFSSETIFHPNPCGIHNTFKYIKDLNQIRTILSNVPKI